jgi:hypothetical protein
MLLDIIQPNQELDIVLKDLHTVKSQNIVDTKSEEFNDAVSLIEFPIDQNYFVLCEIQFP